MTLNMPFNFSSKRVMAIETSSAVMSLSVIPVILSTSSLNDWRPSRLSDYVLWPCSTEISKTIYPATGAASNACVLDLPLFTLLIGMPLFCIELYSTFASICIRFSVSPEQLTISLSVSLPSSKNFNAILSFSCSTAFACRSDSLGKYISSAFVLRKS